MRCVSCRRVWLKMRKNEAIRFSNVYFAPFSVFPFFCVSARPGRRSFVSGAGHPHFPSRPAASKLDFSTLRNVRGSKYSCESWWCSSMCSSGGFLAGAPRVGGPGEPGCWQIWSSTGRRNSSDADKVVYRPEREKKEKGKRLWSRSIVESFWSTNMPRHCHDQNPFDTHARIYRDSLWKKRKNNKATEK